jgi:hypothetical protein
MIGESDAAADRLTEHHTMAVGVATAISHLPQRLSAGVCLIIAPRGSDFGV